MALGLADPFTMNPFNMHGETKQPYNKSITNSEEHKAIAKEAADQSFVLLQNNKGPSSAQPTLPFDPPEDVSPALLSSTWPASSHPPSERHTRCARRRRS